MADTKVKISHILDSQIPDFIHDENPLFKEFLNQYYISQEHEYGNIVIAENITDVKNISIDEIKSLYNEVFSDKYLLLAYQSNKKLQISDKDLSI